SPRTPSGRQPRPRPRAADRALVPSCPAPRVSGRRPSSVAPREQCPSDVGEKVAGGPLRNPLQSGESRVALLLGDPPRGAQCTGARQAGRERTDTRAYFVLGRFGLRPEQ